MADDWTWTAPGDGVWWLTKEHLPLPVSRLHAALFPDTTRGWLRGAQRYGVPMGEPRWGCVNHWYYFSPSEADPTAAAGLEDVARETLETKRWRDEARAWREEERPAVLATNRKMQAEDVGALDDDGLVDHLHRAMAHFSAVAPLHFEHTGFDIVGGLLFQAASALGVSRRRVAAALAGASPASAAAAAHITTIAREVRAAGADPPRTIDEIRTAGPSAAAAVDAYLDDYGVRVGGNDLVDLPLGEQPAVVVASVRAALERATPAPTAPGDDAALLADVPDAERDQFAALLADARSSYGLRDDDVGICYSWPLGLVRRAVLELGRRLVARSRIHAPEDLFEADPAELDALAAGSGPTGNELAARAASRCRAAGADPPLQLGEMPAPGGDQTALPPHVQQLVDARDALWAFGGRRGGLARLQGTGVGTEVGRGRAFVLDGDRGLDTLEPGDVLIATATMSNHNVVFPIAAAVATEEGGPFSHAAILARELGLPAVVGVDGLLDDIHHGDLVEVDPVAGEVRIVERAPD